MGLLVWWGTVMMSNWFSIALYFCYLLWILVLMRPVLILWVTPYRASLPSTLPSLQPSLSAFSLAYCMGAFVISAKLSSTTLTLLPCHLSFLLFPFNLLNLEYLLPFRKLYMQSIVKNVILMRFLYICRVNLLKQSSFLTH